MSSYAQRAIRQLYCGNNNTITECAELLDIVGHDDVGSAGLIHDVNVGIANIGDNALDGNNRVVFSSLCLSNCGDSAAGGCCSVTFVADNINRSGNLTGRGLVAGEAGTAVVLDHGRGSFACGVQDRSTVPQDGDIPLGQIVFFGLGGQVVAGSAGRQIAQLAGVQAVGAVIVDLDSQNLNRLGQFDQRTGLRYAGVSTIVALGAGNMLSHGNFTGQVGDNDLCAIGQLGGVGDQTSAGSGGGITGVVAGTIVVTSVSVVARAGVGVSAVVGVGSCRGEVNAVVVGINAGSFTDSSHGIRHLSCSAGAFILVSTTGTNKVNDHRSGIGKTGNSGGGVDQSQLDIFLSHGDRTRSIGSGQILDRIAACSHLNQVVAACFDDSVIGKTENVVAIGGASRRSVLQGPAFQGNVSVCGVVQLDKVIGVHGTGVAAAAINLIDDNVVCGGLFCTCYDGDHTGDHSQAQKNAEDLCEFLHFEITS